MIFIKLLVLGLQVSWTLGIMAVGNSFIRTSFNAAVETSFERNCYEKKKMSYEWSSNSNDHGPIFQNNNFMSNDSRENLSN